tara:strand:+ start:654 stop:1031 length:378 start_codon:yes stop_codon:yes gene_type:complete
MSLYLIFISAFSFLFYGFRSLFSKRMICEYDRWGYGNFRIIIATFQIFGGLGLLLGIFNLYLLQLVSFLLMTMMLYAILVRIRVKDSIINTLPAIIYALLNLSIFLNTFHHFKLIEFGRKFLEPF